MVDADTNRRLMLAADIQQVREAFLEFGGVLTVVARVDTHRLHLFSRSVRHFGIEMYICH